MPAAPKHNPQPSYMKCKKCNGEADAKSFSVELNESLCKKCANSFKLWKLNKKSSGNAFFSTDFLKRGEK